MAYLTSFSYSKLCQELKLDDDFKITLEVFLEHIYNDKVFFYILNKLQLEYLFKYRMLLADTETFALKYYKQVPEEEDNKVWVFSKGGRTKYHLSLDCKTLRNDFIDFKIPDDIKEKGNQAIDEYRNWFSSQGYAQQFKNQQITKEKIIDAFNNKYPKMYGFNPIEDSSNLLILELKNSGINHTEHRKDVKKIILELNELLLKHRESFPCPVTRTLAKFNYLRKKEDNEINEKMSEIFTSNFVKNYGIDKLKKKFQEAHEITYEITKRLLEYFKWTFNLREKDFDELLLEKFGLVCCKSCGSQSVFISEL